MIGRLPQFAIVEDFFSLSFGSEVLRARYDELLKAVDSGDPADANNWLEYAREIGLSEPDLAHFFEHWLGLDGDRDAQSETAYFPGSDAETLRSEIVGGFLEAVRAGRLHGLPLAVVLVCNQRDALRVTHVVSGPAVVVIISVPLTDDAPFLWK